MDSMQLWEAACESLRSELTEVTYNTWISSALKPLELDGDTFYIKAMTDFYHQFVVHLLIVRVVEQLIHFFVFLFRLFVLFNEF